MIGTGLSEALVTSLQVCSEGLGSEFLGICQIFGGFGIFLDGLSHAVYLGRDMGLQGMGLVQQGGE